MKKLYLIILSVIAAAIYGMTIGAFPQMPITIKVILGAVCFIPFVVNGGMSYHYNSRKAIIWSFFGARIPAAEVRLCGYNTKKGIVNFVNLEGVEYEMHVTKSSLKKLMSACRDSSRITVY